MEKLKQLYNEYDFNFTDDNVTEAVKEILTKNFDKYNNVEVWKQCFNQIDLTSLNSTDTEDKIGGMMERVNEFKEKNYNPIVIRGVQNEIWLENLDEDYKVVRIVSGYIHNDEQFDFDVFKTKQSTNSIIILDDQLLYLSFKKSGIVCSIISLVSTFNSSVT